MAGFPAAVSSSMGAEAQKVGLIQEWGFFKGMMEKPGLK